MKLFKLGEKSKAVCPFCKGIQSTTFLERDVPLDDGTGLVNNILAGVCDKCDRVISIPQQSVPQIKEKIELNRRPLEARVPRHLIDVMALVCSNLGSSQDDIHTLFRFYLKKAASRRSWMNNIRLLAKSSEAAGKASRRFSTRIKPNIFHALNTIENETHLNDTEVVKGIILLMKKDILEDKDKAVIKEIKEVLEYT